MAHRVQPFFTNGYGVRFEEFKFSFSNDLRTLCICKNMVVEKKGNRDLIWLFDRYWVVGNGMVLRDGK